MKTVKYKKYYLFNENREIGSWVDFRNLIGAFNSFDELKERLDTWAVFFKDRFLVVGLDKELNLVPLYWAVPQEATIKVNGKYYRRTEVTEWHDIQADLEKKRREDLDDEEE